MKELFIDGSRNQTESRIAVVSDRQIVLSIGKITSVGAELEALIFALEHDVNGEPARIFSDCLPLVEAMINHKPPKGLEERFRKAEVLMDRNYIILEHIPRTKNKAGLILEGMLKEEKCHYKRTRGIL